MADSERGRIAGTRKEVIEFDLQDDKVKEAILECIKERGLIRVQLIPKGEIFMGQVLAKNYEQFID